MPLDINIIVTPPSAAQVAAFVTQAAVSLKQSLTAQYLSVYNAVWNNPDGITPQATISAMGTQAAAIFTLSAQLAAMINAAGGSVPASSPAGWTVAFAADGSGTATYTAPAG